MGNEQTKDRDLNMNGKVVVNGVSADITPNGMEIDANGKTIVQQNGGPKSFDLSTESTGYVVVESDSPHPDAPVISETLEAVTQTEQVNESKEEKVNGSGKTFKKTAEPPADVKIVQGKETSNEEQTSVSPPAADPQLELDSCGYDAAAVIATDLREDENSETSTQTDRRADANISTQIADEGQTPRVEGPMEEVATVETAATEEDTLVESAAVVAEEVVEVTADVEPSDSQTAGIIIEEVVIINNDVYENIELRVEQTEVTNSFEINPHKNCDPEEENANETEAEIAEEPETDTNKFSVGGETVDEDHILDEALPLEISSSLQKEVADCAEAVLSAAPESSYIAAVNKLEPSEHEVITEDNDEGASELSADEVLIELALSESGVVTPEVMESKGFPSFEEEPVHIIIETNSEVVCEEPNQTPANQVVPKEEPSIPLQVEHNEATADEAVAVEDVPKISEELHSAEAPSNKLMATDELLKDTSSFPEDESKSESFLEIIVSDESAEVSGDVMADVRPKTVQEEEPGPAVVKDDTEVTLEAAIDALSQDLELSPITSEVAAVENGIPLIEELITATTFVPLSGEQEANQPAPETVAEEMNRDSTEALSNELDAVPDNVKEDTIVQEPPPEEVTRKESEKSVEEVSEDVLAQVKTPEQIPVLSEKPTEEIPSICEEAATTEVLMEELLADTISEKPEVTEIIDEEPAAEQADVPQIEATAEYELCISVQEFVEDNAALTESQDISPVIPTLDEPVAESVEAPLAAAGDDIITEDAMAVCDILTLEKTAPEIIPEGGTEEKTKSESNVNATPSDVEALPVGLHSSFTSVTEVTMDKLQVTENITEELADERADVSQSMTTAESAPYVLVQEELVEDNVTLSISAAEETTDSSPVSSEEPVEGNARLLEPQEDLVVILKTIKDEETDKATHGSDTSDDVSALVDRSSEDSHISTSGEPVAECVEAAANSTLAVEVSTEEVMAEFNLLTTENTAAEIILEGETDERETTDETTSDKVEDTENIFEEAAEQQADVAQIEAPGESVPNISVQEEPIEANYKTSVVAVEEPTDSSPDFSEEPVEGHVSHLEAQVLVENLETTEDEATDVSAQKTDTSGNDVVAVDKNPIDSQISMADEPVAECVEAAAHLAVDVITEEVTAEFNLLTSENTAAEIILEGETAERETKSELNVNSAEDILEKLEVTEHIFEEPVEEQANLPQMEAQGGSLPNISVQQEVVEENYDTSVVAVEETTDSSSVSFEEPVKENGNLLETQEDLVVILKTTEDEVTDMTTHESDTSDDAPTSVDNSCEDSQISTSDEPVAKFVEAVLETIVDDTITEDVMAVCNLVSSAEVVPETIHEGENGEKAETESNMNLTASLHSAEMIEDSPVTTTDMEALPVRQHSAFTSITEATSDKLEDTEIIIEDPADEQADVPQSVTTAESAPCISVQEELVVENVSPLEPQDDLVEILKTTKDEETDKATHESDTSDDVSALVDRSSEDSHISSSDEPVAECVEAAANSILAVDVSTEEVTAEFNLLTTENTAAEIILEGENEERAEGESNVNPAASMQSAILIEDTLVTSTDMGVLPVVLESACTTTDETILEKLEVSENMIEEPAEEQADVPQIEAPGEPVPCNSVQVEIVETIDKSAVAVEELRDSSSVISEEPEEGNFSHLKAQVLFENLETTEDKVTEASKHQTDTSDNVSAADDKNPEDSRISTSDEPVAECVEAVLDTIAEDINVEVVLAECNLVTMEKTASETIHKGETEERAEGESNMNSTASLHSAEMIEDTPDTSKDVEILPVRLQLACITAAEDISEKLEDTKKVLEEHTDAPPMEDTGGSVPCVSVQEELAEENVAISVVAIEEQTDSSPVNFEEPVEENFSLLETQEDLVVILKTTEDKVTDKTTHESDTSDDAPASADRSSEDSQISTSDEPVAECVEAVLDTIVDDITTKDVMAERNLVSSAEVVVPETIHEGENGEKAESESNVNSTASLHSAEMIEDSFVSATDMEALPVKPHSAFISVFEATSDNLEDTENIIVEIADEQADVPQMEATRLSMQCFSLQEELVEENYDTSIVAVEETTSSSPVNSEEPVKENVSPLEPQEDLVVILKTTEDEVTDMTTHGSDTSDDAPASVDRSSEDSHISTSNEPVAECVEAVDTVVDEITTEEVMAECNLLTLEKAAAEIILEGENEERAEGESNVNPAASMQSAILTEDTLVTSTDMGVLPVVLQSACVTADETTSDKVEDTENIFEEPAEEQADVAQIEAPVPCNSVQEELVKENYDTSVVAVEKPTDSSPVNFEEPVEGHVSHLEAQVLVENLETTEDEATDVSAQKTSGNDVVAVDKNPVDSQISTSDEPVAECVEAVLDTIINDITTKDVMAECNLESSAEVVVPETIPEGKNGEKAESESNVNSTASPHGTDYLEDSSVSATDMEVLPVGLHSTFTSVTEVTMDKLLVTINMIEDPAYERADVSQSVTTAESVPCVQEELVEENVNKSVVAVDETTDSSAVNFEEPVEENLSPIEPQDDLVVILKTTEDEVTDMTIHGSDTSDDVSASVDRSSEDSHISTSDEPVAECVEAAAYSTLADDITTEDVIDEWNLMTLEKVTLNIIAEEETEERAEGESNVTSTASTQSAKLIEDTLDATTDKEVFTVRLESARTTSLEAIPETLEATENIVKESFNDQADAPPMEVTGEFVPWVSVQEELDEENVDKSVVVEPKDYSPVNLEEPVKENVSPLEPQELVVILKKTEDEVTDKATHESDTSDDVLAAVDKNSEDSQISAFSEPVAEYVEAVVDSMVADDIMTEDVTAECFIVTSEKTAPEISPEEKTNVISAASTQGAEMIEDSPFTSTDIEVLTVSLESDCTRALEVIPVGLAVTQNIFEEPAVEQSDAPAMEVTGGSAPCISVQEEPVEENVAISVVALEETTDSSPVNFEELVERSESSLEPQEDLLILKTTQDKFTEKSTHETDTLEKNSGDSQISTSDEPAAECVEVVLDTISKDITTEDITAECNMTLVRVVPEIITAGDTAEMTESESHATALTQTAEMIEKNTPITSTDMEALLVSLQSACTSVVEKSAFRLHGFLMSSLEYGITVSIHVAPKKEQH